MKTEYKHLVFLADIDPVTFEKVYICENKSGEFLGTVEWYSPWKQYCFNTDSSIFSKSCLDDISDFIGQLSKK